MDTQEEFWGAVRDDRDKLSAALQKDELTGQVKHDTAKYRRHPRKPGVMVDMNTVFMTSVKNRDRGTNAGFVCMMTVEVAGQKLTEQTHRVSTPEEIKAYRLEHAQRRATIRQSEVNRKMTHMQIVKDTAIAMQDEADEILTAPGDKN